MLHPVLGFADIVNKANIYGRPTTCPQMLCVVNGPDELSLMFFWLRRQDPIQHISIEGKESGEEKCIMYYEVYCNRVKHRCLRHSPFTQGIYNQASKIEGDFKMVC